MKEFVYSSQKTGYVKGVRYVNPRMFAGPRPDAQSVIIIGKWPKIADAYRHKNVPVKEFDTENDFSDYIQKRADLPASRTAFDPVQPKQPASPVARTDVERNAVRLPEEGEEQRMAWPLLRQLASEIADTNRPIRSREDAETVIKEERARRAAKSVTTS
jgi:hypothetical protein